MPLPRWLARLNRRVTNPILGIVARRVPPFAMIRHVGRRSGRTYDTPVMVFRRGDIGVIALTYGPATDWVKNVIAAGGCELRVRGQATRWVEPEIVDTAAVFHHLPVFVRAALRVLRADDFLRLRAADGTVGRNP